MKDSDIFGLGGSGGSVVRKYVAGMTVEHLGEIRSVLDGLTYIRMSSTPPILVLTKDPSLDYDNFGSSDNTNVVGTIKSMVDSTTDESPLKLIGNQGWLKSGNMMPTDQLTRSVPENITHPFTVISHKYGTSNGGLIPGLDANAIYPCQATTDDAGNWLMAICQTSGYQSQMWIIRSTDDGITWAAVSPTATPSGLLQNIKITTNKTGRWWLHTGVNNTMYYSDNIGTSWVAMTPPTTGTANVLKYENGSLFYAANTAVNYSNSVSGFVTLGYRCDAPLAATPTWSNLEFNKLIPFAEVGHNTDTKMATVHTIDKTANGSIWLTATTTNAGYAGALLVMFYNSQTTQWSCMPGIFTPKNTTLSITPMHVIGTVVEGGNLRLCFGNTTALYEFLYYPNKDIYQYTLFTWSSIGGSYASWSGFSSATAIANNYIKIGNYRFISWSGSYTIPSQGATLNYADATYLFNGGEIISPKVSGSSPGYAIGTYGAKRSANGTTIFCKSSINYYGVGRARPAVGLPVLRSEGAGRVDFLRVQ